MPDGSDALSLEVAGGLGAIEPSAWDACVPPGSPFTTHAFLSALEDSGSVGGNTGWTPRHLIARAPDGTVAGVAPLYAKSHSYGEYVFDWAWADAYARAGGSYYPKLQCAVPFTPVTGPRLLVRPDAPLETRATLAAGMVAFAEQAGVSSLHVTFPDEDDWDLLGDVGLLKRIGHQYHWDNVGYASFDDFLAALSSRKRKAVRKERQAVRDAGVTLRAVRGAEITPEMWTTFYRFYRNTVDKKWGGAYLTRSFFPLMGERMGDAVVLIVAEHEGRTVAGALNMVGGGVLFGRNWGCAEDFKFLHFETCYYQAIEFAIANGLKRVEAGAQGSHKIQRGYLPQLTYSAHWIRDPNFRDAIARYLEQETEGVEEEMAELAQSSPFRQENPGQD